MTLQSRSRGDESLEAWLAVVARDLLERLAKPVPHMPDYADFRDAFRPRVALALLEARLEEVNLAVSGESLTKARQLYLMSRAVEIRTAIEAARHQIAEIETERG